MELSKTFRFEAAHRLLNFPEGHKCRRLHGHSFQIEVQLNGPVDNTKGIVMDYGDITRAVNPILDRLDHNYLNEIEGLENPTSENLAKWIWDKIKPDLPMLTMVAVQETCTSRCSYYGS